MPWTSLHASYDNPMHAAYKVECLTCVSCWPTPPPKLPSVLRIDLLSGCKAKR